MRLFSKPTYEELMLPFKFEQAEEDTEAGAVSIIAYGDVFGAPKSCYATYGMKNPAMYNNGDYEAILNLLKDHENKKVRVLFKMKNGKAKDFTIDLSSLASVYHDDRFQDLDLLAWGLNDQ